MKRGEELDILKELDDELIDIAILGISNLENNYRFEVLRKKFNDLKSYSPVLEKISEYINLMYESLGSERTTIYLNLKSFIDAIFIYIADLDLTLYGATDYATYNIEPKLNLSYEMIKHASELLESNLVIGKWSKIKDIYMEDGFLDNRLIKTILNNLDNSYIYADVIKVVDGVEEYEEFSIVDIIKKIGVTIINPLIDIYYCELKAENRATVKWNILKSIKEISIDSFDKFINELLLNKFMLEDEKEIGIEASFLFNKIVYLDGVEEIIKDIEIMEYKKVIKNSILKKRKKEKREAGYLGYGNKK